MPEQQNEQWAIVELMGHGLTAGRIEMGALLRVDVPDGDTYRTEFYGMAAIYSVKIVSDEIARAYATRKPDIIAYDAPVVTREKYETDVEALQNENYSLMREMRELERRLPEPNNES